MTERATTLNTKRMLAQSLRRRMRKKSFAKITVSEIVADCGVNRKTFYYHFTDVPDLLSWLLEDEAMDIVRQFDLSNHDREAIAFSIDYIDRERDFLFNAYGALGWQKLRALFHSDFSGLVRGLIDLELEKGQVRVAPEYATFLCGFFTEGLAAAYIERIRDGSPLDASTTIDYVLATLRHSLPAALDADPEAGAH